MLEVGFSCLLHVVMYSTNRFAILFGYTCGGFDTLMLDRIARLGFEFSTFKVLFMMMIHPLRKKTRRRRRIVCCIMWYEKGISSVSTTTYLIVSFKLDLRVYKGYNMSKEAEAFLLSHGLKDALYSIRAVDFRQDLFGTLVPCPFQHPHVSIGKPERMFQQLLGSQTGRACILEFDGACRGNPGISGAGAVLRTPDGTLFCRLREGLGTATNNVAEYRAMILGLRYALSKGFTSIYVVGDSKLVCMQIQGLWRVRHPNIIKWYEEAKKLKDEFLFFQVNHVLRAKNSAADAQANLAVVLADGEVQEEDVDTMKTDSQSQQSMELINFNLQPHCQ